MGTELPFDLGSVIQQASKLQLKGGLAGKICQVLLVVAIALAAISWSVRTLAVAMTAMAMIFLLTGVALWRLLNLAERNPSSALMEGAEFLLHEQMILGKKDQPLMVSTQEDVVEAGKLELSPEERKALTKPDTEPPKRLSSGEGAGE